MTVKDFIRDYKDYKDFEIYFCCEVEVWKENPIDFPITDVKISLCEHSITLYSR